VITALLLSIAPVEAGRLAAVRVRGARITGDLDLSQCAVQHPLSIIDSHVDIVRASNGSYRSVSPWRSLRPATPGSPTVPDS
jgi:hypothetical protein